MKNKKTPSNTTRMSRRGRNREEAVVFERGDDKNQAIAFVVISSTTDSYACSTNDDTRFRGHVHSLRTKSCKVIVVEIRYSPLILVLKQVMTIRAPLQKADIHDGFLLKQLARGSVSRKERAAMPPKLVAPQSSPHDSPNALQRV